MRCPDCSKFVSFDTDSDPEINNIEVDDDGNVSGEVRIVNTCAECSSELTEATLEIEEDMTDDITAHREAFPDEKDAHDTLDVDTAGESRFDEMVRKDRNGKPIKNSRYMKRLYGAEVEITVTCKCGETFTRTWRDSVQASGMDSLV
jgi:hypothetical protein